MTILSFNTHSTSIFVSFIEFVLTKLIDLPAMPMSYVYFMFFKVGWQMGIACLLDSENSVNR